MTEEGSDVLTIYLAPGGKLVCPKPGSLQDIRCRIARYSSFNLKMASTELSPNQHPMVPPSELLKQWEDDWFEEREHADVLLVNAYAAGALAGADAELEACCEWLNADPELAQELRADRRPKPPSLKEQALETLKYPKDLWSETEVDTIRRALEQLDD